MKKNQQQQLIIVLLLCAAGYYFSIYLPKEENKKKEMEKEKEPTLTPKELEEEAWDKGRIWDLPINSWADKEVKKFRSTLVRKYQEDAMIFPDGDKNKNFYFSRAAVYKIHFPPALQEYYEKAKENEIDCSLLEKEEELILSDKILDWEKKVVESPVRGEPDSDKRDNSALFYGAPGTGKTATMKNICIKANKYPLVEIKGSALTPTKDDQDSGLLPLKKFQYTISELEWALVKECDFEREENGEVRYILFVDEADQISNNALTHDPTKLRFLKDCLEGVDKYSRSGNLWVFATNYLKDIDSAVYREGRLSNPLDFSWTWGEFKKYAEKEGIYDQLPQRWQDTNFLNPEDNNWVKRFNTKLFQKEFLGNDPDKPDKKKFWELFIENNPDAQYDPNQDKKDEDDDNEEETKLKDIEIGEFLEFFWCLYDSGDLAHYDGKFENLRKPTVEKVLETHLVNLSIKIDEKMDDLIDEVETSRIEGRKEILASIQKIFEILGKRTQ